MKSEKILKSYKKIAKSMLVEGNAWDRKFGDPLPTIQDVIWHNMNEEEQHAHLNGMKEASQDDDDYVHIGYGKYKEKNMVDDPQAPTFKKDDSGAFVPSKDTDKESPKGDDEKKPVDKSKSVEPDEYERDFEDDEEAKAAAFADMEDEFDDMDEGHGKVITLNGKKYKQVED